MRHRSFTLECTPETFQAKRSKAGSVRATPASPGEAELCRRLWSAVGAGFWTDRSRWDQARWRKQLEQPNVSFWVARVAGREAGAFELTELTRGVKIQGFGLLPSHRGRGLGGALLTAATRQAFAGGARRVWLHTATDDHPHALPNYLSRGFRVVRVRELRRAMAPRGKGKARGTRSGRLMRHVKLRPDREVDAQTLRKLIDTAYLDMKRRLGSEELAAALLDGDRPERRRRVT